MNRRTGQAPGGGRGLRRDARDNLEKVKVAALALFTRRGLGVSFDEIAQYAGVSTGTVYNRFASREDLIDAVVPEVARARLESLMDLARRGGSAWDCFESFVRQSFRLQADDPLLNDAFSARYPQARELERVCEESLDFAAALIADAHRDGTLRADFTIDDLALLLWSTSAVLGSGVADRFPGGQERALGFLLDGLHVT